MKQCTVYIDEAGDLGIKKGTTWFVLSAVIVDKSEEKNIRNIIESIRSRLNLHEIHFRKLRNFEQKCFVVSQLDSCPFDLINIIVDTSKITMTSTDRNGPPSIVSYNYWCRLLLERVSWLLRDSNRIGDIILSARGTSRDNELILYIKNLIEYSDNEVFKCFNRVTSKSASKWDLLQLADVCATSIFHYHEPNRYGFITPCYCYRFKDHIYKRNNNVYSYGLKYYSSDMKPEKEYFIEKMICR